MMKESDADAAEVPSLGSGFMLWQITNSWQRALRAALAPTDLTYVQAILLVGLQERIASCGNVSQAGLAQSLGVDPMMTSQVLRTLETAGLISRQRDPHDTRVLTVHLTEVGEAKLRSALPVLQTVDTNFFGVLGGKEERFVKSLRKLWRKRRFGGMPDGDLMETAKSRRIPAEPVSPPRKPARRRPAGINVRKT